MNSGLTAVKDVGHIERHTKSINDLRQGLLDIYNKAERICNRLYGEESKSADDTEDKPDPAGDIDIMFNDIQLCDDVVHKIMAKISRLDEL